MGASPYLQAALLCDGITTDPEGRHDIRGEFSQYTMGYSQPFTVLSIWRVTEGQASGQLTEKLEIIAPDGRIVASGENGPFEIPDSTYRQVNSLLLENVDFTHEGRYELHIALKQGASEPVEHAVIPVTVV